MKDIDEKEDTESARVAKRKIRGVWKDSHVIFFVLPVVLTILFPGGGIFYLCGRFSPGPLTVMHISMFYLAAIVFII